MLLLTSCRCPFRLMRRCFLGKWICQSWRTQSVLILEWIRVFQYFGTCYHVTKAVHVLVVGALTLSALPNSLFDLKAVQCSLIQKLMLYKFKPDHNAGEATKNICREKDEGALDYTTVIRWLKTFCMGCKNLDSQALLDRPKTVYSKTEL